MRFPEACNKRVPRGGYGLALGDRLNQPVEIHQDAIGGLVEFFGILRGECSNGLRQLLARGRQNLEGLLALNCIGCGEKARRGGGNFTGGSNDLRSARNLRKTLFGDCAERTPKAAVRDNRAAARQHGERSDYSKGCKQSTAKAQVIP